MKQTRQAALRALSLVVCVGVAHGQSRIHQWVGNGAGDRFGGSVAFVDDVDGDGVADVAVGSPFAAGGHGSVRVFSGAGGAELWRRVGAALGERFGCSVSGLGDVDGDGRGDLVVGACFAFGAGGPGAGRALVVSGSDGTTIRTHVGSSSADHFGWAVAGLEDVDGDGVADLAVSAVDADPVGANSGQVRVFSGATGALHLTLNGAVPQELFGFSLAAAGDLDGDHRTDLVVGAPGFAGAGVPGIVRMVSGADGTTLRTLVGSAPGDAFGSAVAGAGDVDLDGVPDVIVGARRPIGGGFGYARAVSGADGSVIHHVSGDAMTPRFGAAVAGAGDVDLDGHADFVVATSEALIAGPRSGLVRVIAGVDGSVLWELTGGAANERVGEAVAGGRDLTGEGAPDLLIGAVGDSTAGPSVGAVRAHRGDDTATGGTLPLEGDVHQISVGLDEQQTLVLNAGSEHGHRRYLMLGTMSGTSPGVTLFGLDVPINPDLYTRFIIFRPRRSPLAGGMGRLDQDGHARVVFQPGPGAQAWVGRTLHHAYLVLGGARSPIFVSNAVPVTLLP